jgi:hypothetical protein
MFTPNFPGYNQNEYIIDEKRKVVVNAKAMTPYQHLIYKRGYFKR